MTKSAGPALFCYTHGADRSERRREHFGPARGPHPPPLHPDVSGAGRVGKCAVRGQQAAGRAFSGGKKRVDSPEQCRGEPLRKRGRHGRICRLRHKNQTPYIKDQESGNPRSCLQNGGRGDHALYTRGYERGAGRKKHPELSGGDLPARIPATVAGTGARTGKTIPTGNSLSGTTAPIGGAVRSTTTSN